MKYYTQIYNVSIWRTAKFAIVIFCSFFISEKSFAADEVFAVNASAVALKVKYTELKQQLENNQFNRPLFLHSDESPHDLKGEIYAVVDHPFSTFNSAFSNPSHWCDAVILNLNVKYCHETSNEVGEVLILNIGKKYPQLLEDTYRLEFKYNKIITTSNYFSAEFNSKDGPLGTHDYRILIEATPLKDGHTFLHFTYAYSFGTVGRLAMQTYLATLARAKIGFTITGKNSDGQVVYIQGIRGVVERNTMRYYLAIDAYLATLKTPADKQLEKSLQYWYNSSEEYAGQLHEVELNEYLDMKHQEYKRQQMLQ